MSNHGHRDPTLDDLRTGLRRRSRRRRRLRATVAASAAAVVVAVSGASARQQSAGPGAPGFPPAVSSPATYTPVSSGECFTSLAACGLSSGQI
jgi:hypothetical protein